jgi:GTP-binding protein
MRRINELQIGQPQVIIKEIDGKKNEPTELTIDLPENLSGRAVEFVTIRKGEMLSMEGKGMYGYKIQYSITWNYRVA